MFLIYVLFLIISGILMLVLGCLNAPYAKRRRVLNLIVGAGFTAYGLYLLLFFGGGHYLMFFYAFILPILLVVQFFRDRSAYKAAQGQQAAMAYGQQGYAPPMPPGQQPYGYGQPQPPAGYAPAPGQPPGYGQPPASGQPSAYDQPGYGLPGGPGQQPPPQY